MIITSGQCEVLQGACISSNEADTLQSNALFSSYFLISTLFLGCHQVIPRWWSFSEISQIYVYIEFK